VFINKVLQGFDEWIGRVFFVEGIISLGQKWWWTLFGREISCNQWEGLSMHSKCLVFFPFKFFWGWGRIFFHFSLVLMCSHYVPFKFPMGSQYVPQVPNLFSIACHFHPICFGKCCPRFTYIGGPKGRNSILHNRTLYFGEPPQFLFILVMGQSNWLVAK
jgi:hypothetical protein